MAGFNHLILPDEFYHTESNWLPFLNYLKLRVYTNDDDILELAKIFTQKFESGSIDTTKLGKLAKLIMEELRYKKVDCQIFDQIKTINFIPSYFCNSENNIHRKVFALKKENICIQDSYFKENLDFVWTTNAILPDYCKNVEGLEISEGPSCSVVVDNFIDILKQCSNGQFLEKLNKTEIQELEALFHKYYSKFEEALLNTSDNRAHICRLKDLNCIWNMRNGQIYLDKARCFYKNISQEDSVPPFILKIPSSHNKYSELLTTLGSCNRVTFEACAEALEGLSGAKGSKISDVQFDSILSLYKFFLYDDIIWENSPVIQFYAPNSEGILHKLDEMYYDLEGPENFEYLRRNAPNAIQINLIFDIEFLRTKYLATSGQLKHNDSNLKKTAVFKEMNSWGKIFRTMPYFVKNSKLAPKPLSNLTERRIIDENLAVEIDVKLNLIFK